MQSLDIQSYSYDQRESVLPLLTRTLTNCGGWIHDRKTVSDNMSELALEIELRYILDLYAGLIASGLELTRSNHMALTDLCTCRRHLAGTAELSRIVAVHVEISFLQEATLHTLLMTGSSLA